MQASEWIMTEVNLMFPNKENQDVKDELEAIIRKYNESKEIISEWGNMMPNDHSEKVALVGVFSDSNRKRRQVFDVLPSLRNVDRSVSISLKGDLIDG